MYSNKIKPKIHRKRLNKYQYKFISLTELGIIIIILQCFLFHKTNNFTSTPKKVIHIIIPLIFSLLLNVGAIYNFFILLREGLTIKLENKAWLIALFRSLLSSYLWWIIFMRRKTIWKMLYKLKKFADPVSSSKNALIIAVFGFFFSVILPVIYVIIFQGKSTENNFDFDDVWFMGYTLRNQPELRKILAPLCTMLFCTGQFIFPNIISLIYCVLTWNISKLAHNVHIPKMNKDFGSILKCLLVKHRVLTAFTKELEDNFTFVIFCLVMYYMSSLFSIATAAMGLTHLPRSLVIFDSSFGLIVCIVFFGSIVICASSVPMAFCVLKENLRTLYQRTLTLDFPLTVTDMKHAMLLKSVIDEKELHFTVWGFVNINKSLVFSAFGALLTYGVLAEQLKT